MPWIELENSDIYYHEEGSGQPLVLLHGNSSCCEAWFQQFAHFRDRYRVIAYDSINHGHSSNSPRDQGPRTSVDFPSAAIPRIPTTRIGQRPRECRCRSSRLMRPLPVRGPWPLGPSPSSAR